MKFRTTLIFAVILALFGAYVYFFEYKKPQEKTKKQEEEKKVLRIDWDKLKGLNLVNSNGTFVFEKSKAKKGDTEEDQWRITSPIESDAEGSTLNGLVTTLKNLKVEQLVAEDPKDLTPFGLNAPKIKIGVLLTEGSPPPLLLVGGKSPVGSNSYAMVQGEKKVLLASTDLGTQFDKKLFDLREKKVFQFKRDDVEKLTIEKNGSPVLDVAKKGDKWEMVYPFKARASETELNKIVNKLVGLRAESFENEAAPQLSTYGLDKPEWKIEVSLVPDHSVTSLSLGKTYKKESTGYVYGTRGGNPVVVALKDDLIPTLDKKAEDLREKKILPFKSWEVHKCDLSLGGSTVTVAKDESSKWKITSPITARANATKITSFITALSQLEAVDFVPPPPSQEGLAAYGLKDPSATVVLYEKGDKKIGTIHFGKGKADKDANYAITEDGDAICKIKPEFMTKDLPKGTDDIREKKLLDFYRYQVARIDAVESGNRMVLEKKGSAWKLAKPESKSVENKDVEGLLSLLADLEADRFVAQDVKDLSPYGLDKPATTITLANDKGEGLATLLISSKGPEDDPKTCYGKEGKDTWIGLIKAEVRKTLQDRIASFYKKKG